MESVRQFKLPDVKRKCLVESYVIKSLRRNLSLEIADEKDRAVIEHFLDVDFLYQEPMNLAIDLTVDELAMFVTPILDECLSQKVTVLAIDDGCLCGIFINNIQKTNNIGKWTEPPTIKDDYGEEFDSHKNPCENYKNMAVMLEVVEPFIDQNLPIDVKDYLHLNLLSVHKDYSGNGLAKKLTVESCRNAYQLGYSWAQVSASSIASNTVFQKLGFKQICSFEWRQFKIHGKQIYSDELCDGGKQLGVYVTELKPIVSKY